jgi:hypothetical protein
MNSGLLFFCRSYGPLLLGDNLPLLCLPGDKETQDPSSLMVEEKEVLKPSSVAFSTLTLFDLHCLHDQLRMSHTPSFCR